MGVAATFIIPAFIMSTKKIGTQLVQRVFDALKAEGISEVSLAVYIDNEGGNRFWERMGFSNRDFLQYKSKALIELEWYD